MNLNKYGVPHEKYILIMENGNEVTVDIGDKEDYSHINPNAAIDEYGFITEESFFGYGDDNLGYQKVECVIDCDTDEGLDISRFSEIVASYSSNYGM